MFSVLGFQLEKERGAPFKDSVRRCVELEEMFPSRLAKGMREFRHLLRAMLSFEPRERVTCAEALKFDFFTLDLTRCDD